MEGKPREEEKEGFWGDRSPEIAEYLPFGRTERTKQPAEQELQVEVSIPAEEPEDSTSESE